MLTPMWVPHIHLASRAVSTILSALASRDADPSVGPPHPPRLTGLLLMRHKLIKTRHARERYPYHFFSSPIDAASMILSALASRDANPSVDPLHSPSLTCP
ncbi:hypothetical protein PIB30_037814 [Stylosanthes scabra]|uniref:Uncharacterized protein n=1 Tax=Stylosanthes scabra TaxID=79078 RepID=A0ABU6QDA5_9FABA|nr:hypothetical protein [Stylosanthes scabra]